jgi:hypothetical protein
VLVGYIGKNMPGKVVGCEILCTCHRKGKDCHGIQNELALALFILIVTFGTHAVCIR